MLAGLGCAITDYEVIVDNDLGSPNSLVNTNGLAKYRPCTQIVTTYADGSDELFSMIDQRADGTGTITTYNNYSTGDEPRFHDDLYCNPDWSGCAIFTAPDENDDNLFDGSVNLNCSGARSLSLLLATSRYYGECGRARLTIRERLDLLNSGALYDGALTGLHYSVNRTNFEIRLEPTGGPLVNVPVFGELDVIMTLEGGRRAIVDADNSMLSRTLEAIESVVASHGAGPYTLSLEYMDVVVDLPVAFTSAEDIDRYGRRHY